MEMGACRSGAAGSKGWVRYESGNPGLKLLERREQGWLDRDTRSQNQNHDDHRAVSGRIR